MVGTIRTCLAFKFTPGHLLIERTLASSMALCETLTSLLTLNGASLRRSSIMSAHDNPTVARRETSLIAALSVIVNSLALLDSPHSIYDPGISGKVGVARYRRWYKILEFRIRRQILIDGVGPHVVVASAAGEVSKENALRGETGVKKPWGKYDPEQLSRWIVEVEAACSQIKDEFDELMAVQKGG